MELTPHQRTVLALHLVQGIGPRLMEALLARFGSEEGILQASVAELEDVAHLGPKVASKLQRSLAERDVDGEIERIQAAGAALRIFGEAAYPSALTSIATPPRVLYIQGSLRAEDERAVAIVGSRACTAYGKRVAEQLGYQLAHAGWTVVSGLARGIDGMAHQGALRANGRTLAILAGGLSKLYPPEHRELAERIVHSGALMTEAPMTMDPMADLFPRRNRIISGLCHAVVLVEAADKSGALITARLAAEQGREVFAVPGAVDSPASAGTLKLLREGARLVRNADDVLEDLGALAPQRGEPVVAVAPTDLAGLPLAAWQALSETRHFEELIALLETSSEELARQLMMLELKKVVRRLPGNHYERWRA